MKSGGEVVLHVRQAAEVISVRCPDLTGMYLSDAISVLRAHGLKAGCVEHSDGDYFSSTVHSQGRPAGSYVPKGCAVDIVLAPSKPENTSENINNKLFFKQFSMTRGHSSIKIQRHLQRICTRKHANILVSIIEKNIFVLIIFTNM